MGRRQNRLRLRRRILRNGASAGREVWRQCIGENSDTPYRDLVRENDALAIGRGELGNLKIQTAPGGDLAEEQRIFQIRRVHVSRGRGGPYQPGIPGNAISNQP